MVPIATSIYRFIDVSCGVAARADPGCNAKVSDHCLHIGNLDLSWTWSVGIP